MSRILPESHVDIAPSKLFLGLLMMNPAYSVGTNLLLMLLHHLASQVTAVAAPRARNENWIANRCEYRDAVLVIVGCCWMILLLAPLHNPRKATLSCRPVAVCFGFGVASR